MIIFSVGYGHEPDGRFTINFGPLNKDGGQRRLNVAVTRARERVELVASVRAHDFKLSDGASRAPGCCATTSRTPRHGGRHVGPDRRTRTKRSTGRPRSRSRSPTPSSELGYHAGTEVGVGSFRIDIGVRAADDAGSLPARASSATAKATRETPTARDRERLRHEVLDGLGWGPIHRIWSLDWVRNRAGEIERLRARADRPPRRARPDPATAEPNRRRRSGARRPRSPPASASSASCTS